MSDFDAKAYAAAIKKNPKTGLSPIEAYEICAEVFRKMQADPKTRKLMEETLARSQKTNRRAAVEKQKEKNATFQETPEAPAHSDGE
jgi:uncharacterized protein with PIN domain